MSLAPGSRLGPYEVIAPIGAGGMGEVYRARDTKLNRDVALKILPDAFASDADRVARFKREAQVLASLNHPNIAQIYGFEDGAGIHALAMELVDGPTLADRIVRGPIPIDEAMPLAKQIAEALEAAHEHGIIHRDLKPANIKVRDDGTVKVLDFGLAKALAPESAAARPAGISDSPTITSPAMTAIGVILGTAAYMSPEQARGRPVDQRADIWAFGCLLYEMLTGHRAFYGEDITDTLAAVVRAEPDWTRLPADVGFPVRTLLQGCLEKDARQRIGHISAARFVLRHQTTGAAIESPANTRHAGRVDVRRTAALTVAALILGAAMAGMGVWVFTRPAAPAIVRTTITTPGTGALMPQGFTRDIAITPDGARVVYRGNDQLLVRALNELEPVPLSGVGVPSNPFVSPDGLWIGFFDGFDTIKKVSITGGPSETVCACGQGAPAGATWGPDGTIIFGTSAPTTGLQRVPAGGGQPTELTRIDREHGEGDHAWPEFLPGGEAVLFTIIPANGAIENAQVAVLDLRTGTAKVLINGGSDARYVPTGHLVYGVAGTLRAVAFDLERLEVVGTPEPVLEGVMMSGVGAVNVAVAPNGSLVYVAGAVAGGGRQTVMSVDRQGRPSPLPGLPPDAYRDVQVSPDGTRLALATRDDVWIYDFARTTLNRLTSNPARDTNPLWTRDGRRIIFQSRRAGYPELFGRPADGTGSDERILGRAKDLLDLFAVDWSKDGSQLLFSEVPPNLQCVINQIPIERPSDVVALAKNDACNIGAKVSPDGRWMAYSSALAGRSEVYVERYPELGNRQAISTGGGAIAEWSHDGKELFFNTPDFRHIFAVPVESGTKFGRPQLLFEFAMLQIYGGQSWDVAPDGRFLIITSVQADTERQIVVVQNWVEELKRLVPVH